MPYAQLFGGQLIYPSQLTYLSLALTADIELQWPVEVALPGNYVFPDILDLTSDQANRVVAFPTAIIAGPGQSILVNNKGAFTILVHDFDGNEIGAVPSGEVWEFYLDDNTTPAGGWTTFEFGTGTSSAVAAALAGAGLKAILNTLNLQYTPRSSAVSPLVMIDSDRAKIVQWTGGLGAGTLPDPATVGSDWFVMVKNNGSGTWTITPTAGSIDGGSNLALSAGNSAIIYTDGADYFTIGLSRSTSTGFDFVSINVAGTGTYTLSGIELNRIAYQFTGVLSGNRTIVVPDNVQQYWVRNATSGAFSLTVKTSLGAGIVVPQGTALLLYCDGTDVLAANAVPTTGVLTTTQGGTNLTAYTLGDILYASATNVLSRLAANASASRYLSNQGASNIPDWQQVNLANGVSGRLPFANLTQGSALSVLGVAGNSVADFASIAAAANDRLLTRVSNVLAFTQLTAGMFPNTVVPDAALSSNVPLKNGTNVFSGLNTFTDGNLVYDGTEVGFRAFPQRTGTHNADYTAAAADNGGSIYFGAAHGAGDTLTIPANGSGDFTSLGDGFWVINDSDTETLALAIDTDTLYLAGTTTTGTLTIEPKGIVLVYKAQTTEWIAAPVGQSILYPSSTGTVYGGFVGSDGSTGNDLPSGWSATRTANPGLYEVTHNLGTTDYFVTACIDGTTTPGRVVPGTIRNANTFEIGWYSQTDSVRSNVDFQFHVKLGNE